MIKTSELRVGNYVRYTSKTGSSFSQITPIDFEYTINKGGEFYFSDSLGISFIPLTPEVLAKCGFQTDTAIGCYSIETETGEIVISFDYILQSTDTITKLQYLHQLQNLYFALTGEELTVNFSTP